jgi:hypothetical protein
MRASEFTMSLPWKGSVEPQRAGDRLRLVDGILLVIGAAMSVWFVRRVLATSSAHLRLDWDLAVTVSLLLAPLGPALTGFPRLVLRRYWREWTIGEWLWLVAIVIGTAWLEVWLDAGVYLGAVAKLICGPIALLLTPLQGLVALVSLVYSLRRRGEYGWRHWLGLLMALVSTTGLLWFVAIMLRVRFPT